MKTTKAVSITAPARYRPLFAPTPTKPWVRVFCRPTPAPSIPLALGARSIGQYRVLPGFQDPVRVKDFVQIYWGVRGVGAFVIHGRERLLGPNQVALYFPGYCHRIYAKNEPWEYWWVAVDGPMAESIVSALGLLPNVYDAPPVPRELFSQLEKAIFIPTPAGERRASILAFELLNRAAAGARPRPVGTQVEKALATVHQEWNSPNFSIKVLANRLGTHRVQLSREFRRLLGIPIQEYVMRLRLQEALSLLRATDESVAGVARHCGFLDPNYFARLIRRKFGASPGQLRRNADSRIAGRPQKEGKPPCHAGGNRAMGVRRVYRGNKG